MACHFHWANFNLNNKTQSLQWMQKTWSTQVKLPKQCALLTQQLLTSEFLTPAVIWQKFELLMLNLKPDIAKKILPYFSDQNTISARIWLQVFARPERVKKHLSWPQNTPQNGWIFAQGIERLATQNLAAAIALWDDAMQDFSLDHHRRQRVEKTLAIRLTQKGKKTAYQRFNQLVFTDQETRAWRIKAALQEQDWRHIFSAVDRLRNQEKRKPKWQYWRARAFWQLREKKTAKRIFSQLAKNRNYYGLIAAEYAGREYQFNDLSFKQDYGKLARFIESHDFQAVQELQYFNRKQESLEQWQYAIKKISPWKLPVAINYAFQQGWKKHAIMAIKYADYLDDIGHYFPTYHRSRVVKEANRRKIDPAVIFAIIRQESAFNKDALSPVGAQGLMQIMPKTGAYIAKTLKEPSPTKTTLFNPETNVRYGAFYFRQMLHKFDNNFVLAAAAYNAGPHRVRRWLPKSNPVAADIWIEMIPFDETRNYVKAVLTYALIYQHQLQSDGLSMLNFLKDIKPS
jgi:soluble lytic murein transglycosylase